ncbi:tudor domain-containing protein 6-like [Asterias rubens]|uniref:tudor domain-containing protein 6-like n=1 Tax=Asterias rubens TaxID=7604 RepID=UPI0014554A2F|nr:tudor domain-containing protein 6-like [Asterias rubens]
MGSVSKQVLDNMGSKVEVYVTAAYTDKSSGLFNFWTQLDPSGVEAIEGQSEKFQYMAQLAGSPSSHVTLQVGERCIAKYLEDGQWYRARIDSVTGNDVIAFFIDYGNTEIIPRNLVRTESSINGKDVFALPAQATDCVLAGVSAVMQHNQVKMGTQGYVTKMLVDQTFVGEPLQMTDYGLEVKLFTQTGDNIAERFIKDEFAVQRQVGIPSSTGAKKHSKKAYTPTTLSVGSRENLYVSNAYSLGQFWIQQASIGDSLDQLMETISQQYDHLGATEKALGAVEVGTPCVATFSEDGSNYRAVVTKMKGSNQCTVQFVDFGNSEVTDTASLKMITNDLMKQPSFAVECLLSGVDSAPSSPKAIDRFNELTTDKELCGKVVGMSGNSCCMLLIDPQGQENADIVSVLVKEGLVSRGSGQTSTATCNGGGDASALKTYSSQLISRGSKKVVQLIAFKGPDDLSCQLMEDANAFNTMMDDIQSEYSNPSHKNTVQSPQIGQSCCVKYSDDDNWYRACIKFIQGNKVTVHYVDYGNGEVVDAGQLKMLKPEFLALPPQCIACCLDGVPTPQGSDEKKAFDWLEGYSEKNLTASVTGVQNDKYTVILKSDKDGTVLNHEIKKILPPQKTLMSPPMVKASQATQRSSPRGESLSPKGAASSDFCAWMEVKMGAKETNVYVSHVEDANKFFCQLVAEEGKLNLLMDKVHTACIENKLKPLMQGCVGMACVAQFSEDSSWYRGVIKDRKPGFYRVCFVDYGNEEDVPVDKVREITTDLLVLPQQAVCCCLSGWDAAWKEDKVAERFKSLAAEFESFQVTVKESKGISVVQLKWQGKDMLQELKKIRANIPKDTKPPKEATPPRRKGTPVATTPPFKLTSAAESVEVGKTALMAASVVKGPTKFFCQLCSTYDQLQQLCADMNKFYASPGSNKKVLTEVIPGAFCAVQSSSDGVWYRAKILHPKGPGKVKVKFVDFGDIDVLPAESLCNLLPKFRSLPTQAIKCSMAGISKKFQEMLLDQEVTVMVKAKNDGKLKIEYKDDAMHAKIIKAFGGTSQPEQSKAVVESKGGSSSTSGTTNYIKQGALGGTETQVYVTHVDNLQSFYIQLGYRSDEIDDLQHKLKTSYDNNASGALSPVKVGTLCCAKFSEDGNWYRAVVTGQPNPGKVIVRFVDFGNSEEQAASALRPLKGEFAQRTIAAVQCRIKGSSSTSAAAADEFLDLAIDKSLKCKFYGKEEPYQVEFPELQAELAKMQSTDTPQSQVSAKEFSPLKGIAIGSKEEVYIASATSPASFWCQLARFEDTLNNLMNAIDAHYSALSPEEEQLTAPTVGAPCIAQFSLDEGWYRARITQVHPDTCTVTFIDYGNTDDVSRSLIKNIKDNFMEVDQQAILCSLGGVRPAGGKWKEEASNHFSDLTTDKKLLAEVVGITPPTSAYQVTLLDLGISLGQQLAKKGCAEVVPITTKTIRFASESDNQPDQFAGFKKLDIALGSSEKVYVTVVNSLHEFYCQIASKSFEELEPLSEDLQAQAPSLPTLTADSILGSPCVAKFSDDEQWYRATVVAEKEDSADVFFVDYGNKESIPRDNMRAMTDAFSSLPAQTLKCALARIPDVSSHDDVAVAKFEELVLESEALMADFVGLKGQTMIVRLRNDGEPVAEALGVELRDDKPEPLPAVPDQSAGSYSWAPLEPSQVVEVFVTTVSSPDDFWCQLAQSEDDLNAVMDSIQSLVIPLGDNLEPQEMKLCAGDMCLAQCAQDGYWYRSEVTGVTSDNITVLFVDNGKTDTMPSAKVRAMQADFMTLPRQAFRCRLTGIKPWKQSWDQDSINAFKKLTSDHSLMAEVVSVERSADGAVAVTLHDGAVPVSDLLVEKSHAKEVPAGHETKSRLVITTPDWDGPTYKASSTPTDGKQTVVILSVTSPVEFYCRVGEETESLETITSKIEEHIQELIGQTRIVPSKGMPCIAKCEDKLWRRAEVLDVVGKDELRVFLVDEAKLQTVRLTDLQLITNTLLAFPLQARKCSLEAAPSGMEWSEEDEEAFREMVDGETLQAEFLDDLLSLYDGEESIIQKMIQRKEDAKAKLEAEMLQKQLQEAADKEALTKVDKDLEESFPVGVHLPDSFKQAFEGLDLKVGEDITLCLVTIDGPDEVSCQFAHNEQKVLDIDQKMLEVYEELESSSWVPQVGDPCAAKHSEFEDWYRATVVSIDQEKSVEVFYADYGGTDKVLLESVRELKDELRQIPSQAIRVHLTKPLVPLTTWNKKAKAALEGEGTERDLHVKVIEVQEKKVVAELSEEDHTFLSQLVDYSQAGSINTEEDEERDGEFFDAVDKDSVGAEELFEAAEEGNAQILGSIYMKTVESLVEEVLIDVAKTLWEEEGIILKLPLGSSEATSEERSDVGASSSETGDEVKSCVAEVIDDLFDKAAEQAQVDDDKQQDEEISAKESENEDITVSNEETSPEETNATEEASPDGNSPMSHGARMISMKDILDQFVDHHLQRLKDNDGVADGQKDNGEKAVEEEESESDVDDEEDVDDIGEVVNGFMADDEESSEAMNNEDEHNSENIKEENGPKASLESEESLEDPKTEAADSGEQSPKDNPSIKNQEEKLATEEESSEDNITNEQEGDDQTSSAEGLKEEVQDSPSKKDGDKSSPVTQEMDPPTLDGVSPDAKGAARVDSESEELENQD